MMERNVLPQLIAKYRFADSLPVSFHGGQIAVQEPFSLTALLKRYCGKHALSDRRFFPRRVRWMCIKLDSASHFFAAPVPGVKVCQFANPFVYPNLPFLILLAPLEIGPWVPGLPMMMGMVLALRLHFPAWPV